METALFYFFSALTLISAILVITLRNTLSSALGLVATLFGMACLFVLLHATFVAALQVLVYAGAVMVLFIFVIMMMDLDRKTLLKVKYSFIGLVGSLFAMYLAAILVIRLGSLRGEDPGIAADYGSLPQVGRLLFTDYLVPFEVTSLLLLVAIVGAVMLTKKGQDAA